MPSSSPPRSNTIASFVAMNEWLEWQPMKAPPRKSGLYAVDDGLSIWIRYAAFDGRRAGWSALASSLADLADDLRPGPTHSLSDCDAWRELSAAERAALPDLLLHRLQAWLSELR